MHVRIPLLALLMCACSCITFASDAFSFSVAVLSGEIVSDGNAELNSFTNISINDSDDIAFFSDVSSTPGGSIPLGIGAGGIYAVTPSGDIGQLDDFLDPFPTSESFSFNEGGQIAYQSSITTFPPLSVEKFLFIAEGSVGAPYVIRDSVLAAQGDGTISDSIAFGPPVTPSSLNALGHIAFSNTLNGGVRRILRADHATALTELARTGELTPDGTDSITGFVPGIELNDSGVAAFVALQESPGVFGTNPFILLSDGGITKAQIASQGQPTPSQDGSFGNFSSVRLNNHSQTAFLSDLSNTSQQFSNDEGLFFAESSGVVFEIAREGQATPSGDGEYGVTPLSTQPFAFGDAFADLLLNDNADVLFQSTLRGTASGETLDTGLFLHGADGGITEIVRTGDDAPGGDKFDTRGFLGGASRPFSSLRLNDTGQVAFIGNVSSADGIVNDRLGVFLYAEQHGLLGVVREGDAFADSIIEELSLFGGLGLSNNGTVAFSFLLADGRSGIATAALNTLSMPGDYNSDGRVDTDDYLLWRATYGSTGNLAADGNLDGIVDAADYSVWRDRLGQVAATTEAVGVPEPTPLTLVGVVFSMLHTCRRSRRPKV